MTPGTQPLDVVTAALLGALQGVAEFLPISSSGHLSLAQHWMEVDPAAGGHTFNIVVHAGTLLAVLFVYRRDLVALVRDSLGMASPSEPEGEGIDSVARARQTLLAIVVGCLPLGVVLMPGVEEFVISLE